MSGPKVVRVVTREEIEAICRGHILEVEAAAEAAASVAQRLDRLDDGVRGELARHNKSMAALFQAENWMEIQKRAPVVVANLRSYADQIRAEAIAAANAERSKSRRLLDGARTLIAALEDVGQTIDPQLRAAAQIAVTGAPNSFAAIETALNEGMRQLAAASANADASGTAALSMAGRLGVGLVSKSLETWLASVPPPNQLTKRLDTALAELKTWTDPDSFHEFERRAAEIATGHSQQEALLTDSLILEASRLAIHHRTFEQSSFDLKKARASLSLSVTDDAKALIVRISEAIAAGDLNNSAVLCGEAAALADREAKASAAQARREAVLKGLSTLGYEIRGGMATAWAIDGRLVVRRPGAQDYGVELGAPGDASRVQMRVVGSDRPTSSRTAERDRDQEVIWCHDLDALQESVASAGGHVVIERAIGVGVQPVKTVGFADSIEQAEAIAARPAARSLR